MTNVSQSSSWDVLYDYEKAAAIDWLFQYQLLDWETGAGMLSHPYNLSTEGADAGELFLVLGLRYRV